VTAPLNPSSIQLQRRDLLALKDLFETRIATLRHISLLHFKGHDEACKKRVAKLKTAGFVDELPRRAYERSILRLTQKGFALLQQHGLLNDFPYFSSPQFIKRGRVSLSTLKHELLIMDFKAAFVSAIAKTAHLSLAEFTTMPAMIEFTVRRADSRGFASKDITVKPDGFVRVIENINGQKQDFYTFIEMDCSTEIHKVLSDRFAAYAEFYRSGGFAVRCGADRSEYRRYPFRVLLAVPTAERRNNCAMQLLAANVRGFVWITTHTELMNDPLGQIWVLPSSYANIDGTNRPPSFERSRKYRRHVAREAHLEQALRKRALFERNETNVEAPAAGPT
jgi:hypothetical protein